MVLVLWEKKATPPFIGNSTPFQHPIAMHEPKPLIFFCLTPQAQRSSSPPQADAHF
jgi:hypothetical protein